MRPLLAWFTTLAACRDLSDAEPLVGQSPPSGGCMADTWCPDFEWPPLTLHASLGPAAQALAEPAHCWTISRAPAVQGAVVLVTGLSTGITGIVGVVGQGQIPADFKPRTLVRQGRRFVTLGMWGGANRATRVNVSTGAAVAGPPVPYTGLAFANGEWLAHGGDVHVYPTLAAVGVAPPTRSFSSTFAHIGSADVGFVTSRELNEGMAHRDALTGQVLLPIELEDFDYFRRAISLYGDVVYVLDEPRGWGLSNGPRIVAFDAVTGAQMLDVQFPYPVSPPGIGDIEPLALWCEGTP